MFEQVSAEILQRAMNPPLRYGRHILAETLANMQTMHAGRRKIL